MSNCLSQISHFQAHSQPIYSVRTGKKRLVSGGEDRRVHVWEWSDISQNRSPSTLIGHARAVHSVCLDETEEMVAAGSASGVIKLWDLTQNQVMRTFTGHKDSVVYLDFNSIGEFFTSGSADGSVRVWDSRKKNGVFTFVGHEGRIRQAKNTPDGRWIASSATDGIRLWDLTAGKLLYHFPQPQSAWMDFHPSECILSSCDNKGLVSFWDLDSFQQVSTVDTKHSNNCLAKFHKDGTCFIVANPGFVTTISWEPPVIHDCIRVALPDCCDSKWQDDEMMIVGMDGCRIGVYSLNVKELAPFNPNKLVDKFVISDDVSTNTRPVHPFVSSAKPTLIPPLQDKVLGLSHDLDKSIAVPFSSWNENEILDQLIQRHEPINHTLTIRSTAIKELASFTSFHSVIQELLVQGNKSVTVDILQSTLGKPGVWTLDVCRDTLPLLTDLIQSNLSDHLTVAADTSVFLLKQFAPIITSTLSYQGIGVDISREERTGKCQSCRKDFATIYSSALPLSSNKGLVGMKARQLVQTYRDHWVE